MTSANSRPIQTRTELFPVQGAKPITNLPLPVPAELLALLKQ